MTNFQHINIHKIALENNFKGQDLRFGWHPIFAALIGDRQETNPF